MFDYGIYSIGSNTFQYSGKTLAICCCIRTWGIDSCCYDHCLSEGIFSDLARTCCCEKISLATQIIANSNTGASATEPESIQQLLLRTLMNQGIIANGVNFNMSSRATALIARLTKPLQSIKGVVSRALPKVAHGAVLVCCASPILFAVRNLFRNSSRMPPYTLSVMASAAYFSTIAACGIRPVSNIDFLFRFGCAVACTHPTFSRRTPAKLAFSRPIVAAVPVISMSAALGILYMGRATPFLDIVEYLSRYLLKVNILPAHFPTRSVAALLVTHSLFAAEGLRLPFAPPALRPSHPLTYLCDASLACVSLWYLIQNGHCISSCVCIGMGQW